MSIFDKWREINKQRKLTADRPVRLTINYTTAEQVLPTPAGYLQMFTLRPAQLIVVAPWSMVKQCVMDDAKKEELRNMPGFDCCVLEILP